MKPEKLYLFVWNNVLEDYTCGIAFAMAHNATEAKNLLIKAGIDKDRWEGIKLDGQKPKRHSKPTADYTWGGG